MDPIVSELSIRSGLCRDCFRLAAETEWRNAYFDGDLEVTDFVRGSGRSGTESSAVSLESVVVT